MTEFPSPAGGGQGEGTDTAVYDAWNRLVEVDNASGPIEKYSYDGTGRRIQVQSNFTGSTAGTVQDDYLAGQQVIESDVTGGALPAINTSGRRVTSTPRSSATRSTRRHGHHLRRSRLLHRRRELQRHGPGQPSGRG